jgi:hypothetical protein
LIEIQTEFADKDLKDHFIALVIENIRKSDTFYSSIIFLRRLLNAYPLDSQLRFKPSASVPSVSTVLNEIFRKIDLFDMILANAHEYLKAAH